MTAFVRPSTGNQSGLRVEGDQLVVSSGAMLPPRCVKTNEPVVGVPLTKTLYWAHPALYILVLFNLLIFAIVYLCVRKRCDLTFYVSPDAAKKRTTRMIYAAGAALLGFLLIFGGIAEHSLGIAVFGGVLILVGLVIASVFSNVLTIATHKNGEFWIKGCGPEFLDSIRNAPQRSRF
jgi:hypothetical protein